MKHRYHRTASTMTSGGNRNPANADGGGDHGRARADFTDQVSLDLANAQRNGALRGAQWRRQPRLRAHARAPARPRFRGTRPSRAREALSRARGETAVGRCNDLTGAGHGGVMSRDHASAEERFRCLVGSGSLATRYGRTASALGAVRPVSGRSRDGVVCVGATLGDRTWPPDIGQRGRPVGGFRGCATTDRRTRGCRHVERRPSAPDRSRRSRGRPLG
jgi:hypothetical protein